MPTRTVTLEQLIERCRTYADSKPYCWFRTSYAKVGEVEPQWMVWFETSINLWAGPLQEGCSALTLIEALEKLVALIDSINNVENS